MSDLVLIALIIMGSLIGITLIGLLVWFKFVKGFFK